MIAGDEAFAEEKRMIEVELTELTTIGWIQITDIGEENMYFINSAGESCFCKVAQ